METDEIKQAELKIYKSNSLIEKWVHDYRPISQDKTGGKFTQVGFKTNLPFDVVNDDIPLLANFAGAIIRGEIKYFVNTLKKKLLTVEPVQADRLTSKLLSNLIQKMHPTGELVLLVPISIKYRDLYHEFDLTWDKDNKCRILDVGGYEIPIYVLFSETSTNEAFLFDRDAISWRQVEKNGEKLLVDFKRDPRTEDVTMTMKIIADLTIKEPSKIKIIKLKTDEEE